MNSLAKQHAEEMQSLMAANKRNHEDDIEQLTKAHTEQMKAFEEESNIVKRQFENLLTIKDAEFDELNKRLKNVGNIEALHQAHNAKIAELEAAHARALEEKDEKIKNTTMELKWIEEENDQQEAKIETQNHELENLRKNNEELIESTKMVDDLRRENERLREENGKMFNMINGH